MSSMSEVSEEGRAAYEAEHADEAENETPPATSTLAELFAKGQRIPELDEDDFCELFDLVLEEAGRRRYVGSTAGSNESRVSRLPISEFSFDRPDRVVETTVWERNPDQPPGYLRLARVKSITEVYEELRGALGCVNDPTIGWTLPEGCDEYFVRGSIAAADTPWPYESRICVFVVTGGSEGHYIHVEAHDGEQRQLLILGKTFAGWDAAWKFGQRLAAILDL